MLKKLIFLMGLVLTSQIVQAEIKIGVVNIPLLMANAPQAAEAKKRLEREFSPKDKQLLAQQKSIKRLIPYAKNVWWRNASGMAICNYCISLC